MKLFLNDLKPSTLSVALSFVLLTGCATSKPDSEPWSADKGLIVQSLQDAHVGNAKLEDKLALLDQRVLDAERLIAEQQTKIIMLESAAQKKAVKLPKKKVRKKITKNKVLNKRLDALSAKLKQPNEKKIVASAVQPTDEKNAYTAAYLALKSGRYDEASSGFVKVIKAYPKGEYTDQSYYWLGESLVALLRNSEALESFTVVANQYPKSPKHAAALMKIASIHKGMKYYDQARVALERVIKDHPNGRTAERARDELSALPKPKSGAKK